MKQLFGALALTSLLGLSPVQAGDMGIQSLDYDACRTLVQDGHILSMKELMDLVNASAESKIIETRLLQKGEDYIYEMEVAGSDGMVKTLFVDARTGDEVEPVVAATDQ